MIDNNTFNPIEVAALNKAFDSVDIRTMKDINTGKVLSYIEGHRVISRLNEVFNNDWSFKILSKPDVIENTIIVHGAITIKGVCKEQFGAQKIAFFPPKLVEIDAKDKDIKQDAKPEDPSKPVKKKRGRPAGSKLKKQQVLVQSNVPINLGYDMKAATTDCIKKCASLFGVGLYLYNQDESLPEEVSGVSSAEVKEEIKPKNATTAQLQAIKKMLKKYRKAEFDNFDDYIKEKYKVKNIEDLSYDNAVSEMKELNALANVGAEIDPFDG